MLPLPMRKSWPEHHIRKNMPEEESGHGLLFSLLPNLNQKAGTCVRPSHLVTVSTERGLCCDDLLDVSGRGFDTLDG
jgi:hypothetical protein